MCFCFCTLQVSVYLQNWSHVLSYVSKAESTPEIAEVCAISSSFVLSDHTEKETVPFFTKSSFNISFFFFFVCFPTQQRGERDSQNQAVLTKLKCAAGQWLFSSSVFILLLPLHSSFSCHAPPIRGAAPLEEKSLY